ncbi:MAG: hypothetical protein HXX20_13075 [Chloroflexi bacterium]|nr:hypothetical protein [Chloroflexota bacterium]NWJ96710.1 hypothetical protein [Chloroflexota bacterium]
MSNPAKWGQSQSQSQNPQASFNTIARDKKRTEVEAKATELVRRLDLGAQRIEEANKNGKDTTDWENFWISLLFEYNDLLGEIEKLRS